MKIRLLLKNPPGNLPDINLAGWSEGTYIAVFNSDSAIMHTFVVTK